MFSLRQIDAMAFNEWQSERHYLKRPIIRSKLLAHGVFIDGELVGGLLWSTPHFTKKAGLFGYENTLDKWEVLMLARFYLVDGCGLIASQVLAESIGKGSGRRKTGRAVGQRGWRLQEDWVSLHPPRFPQNPFVPRMLISWSDLEQGHKGTIYAANGWLLWDKTTSGGSRTGTDGQQNQGNKLCWILHLPENELVYQMGLQTRIQMCLPV